MEKKISNLGFSLRRITVRDRAKAVLIWGTELKTETENPIAFSLKHGDSQRVCIVMRKPRVIVRGARYHVMARANRSEKIMDQRDMKELFVSVVRRARKRYRFSIENICLMGNHYHIILLPHEGESLSRIMQWIMSVFAMSWNKKMGLKGHVWGGRFLSSVIGSFQRLCEVIRYIDENPRKACLVKYLWAWEYGGVALHRVLGFEPPWGPIPLWLLQQFPAHSPLCLPFPEH